MTKLALAVNDVTKSFGGTAALKDVSLKIELGEVHALLGHNGSGKSTLIKVISGYHRPDSGTVEVNGHEIHYPTSALLLKDYGVSFMHQDIGLVPTLSILENLRIGRLETGVLKNIRWRRERRTVSRLLSSFGLDLSPDTPVSRLSAAERTVVGVLRAFQDVTGRESTENEGGLVILDEPTAALPEEEKKRLFNVIKQVAASGLGVLMITHHLEEPLQFANRVSVLRDGELVASDDICNHSYDSLAELVVGHSVVKSTKIQGRSFSDCEEVVTVKELKGQVINGVSFSVIRGEILGLTGLMGAGHEELPFLLYGAQRPVDGFVSIRGKTFVPDPVRARRNGLAFVSGDRIRAGGVLSASVAENVTLPVLRSVVGKMGWLRSGEEQAIVQSVLNRFQIKLTSPNLPFSALSGGSQQKALIGRWVGSGPQILLLQEPTAGVDIGASQEIIAILRQFASTGGTVIFSSEQYEDVASLSDRVLVFRDGRISSILSGTDVTPENIVARSYGKIEAGTGSPEQYLGRWNQLF
ncbi:MAG: sugar ABC transporter ATP-binding protein [Acidimicrobiaceae bacterium]|nr:sugar ABC transporter ATP-binding protein [Acidimicrobiaceae bacterium]